MVFLEIKDISKSFGSALVLSHVGLSVEKGSIVCILGPSGCGKTTLLRIIAGLERPDTGAVCFEGRNISLTPPHKRPFGMMFQDFALFPHLDVADNIAFGLQMHGYVKAEIIARTSEMLGLVGLQCYERRNVGELSGGERQRVALARSLAPYPRLLLLDEPLGSLDRALRDRLLAELKGILKRIGMTTIFVSHDQAEAFAMADTIAVLEEGRIKQVSSPSNLYLSPASPSIARFLGLVNLIEGKVEGAWSVRTPLGTVGMDTAGQAPGSAVTVLIRPDAARIRPPGACPRAGEIPLSGVVKDSVFKGREYRVEVGMETGELLVFDLDPGTGRAEAGAAINLLLQASGMRIMPG